jgi:alpha-tubulin suppressor-like RCC1 family protein
MYIMLTMENSLMHVRSNHVRLYTIGLSLMLLLFAKVAHATLDQHVPSQGGDEERLFLPSVHVPSQPGIISIAIAGGNNHTCALTISGGVKCWGDNSAGQVGNDSAGAFVPTPVDVVGLTSDVLVIATGSNHTCALTTSGGVKCWGDNSAGQIGNGVIGNVMTPADVVGLGAGVQTITAGGGHTCALTTSGGVKCWGNNFSGQVGDDTVRNNHRTPVDVVGLNADVQAIDAGGFHSCALTTSGGLKCWGGNEAGQVGDGTMGNDRPSPVDVMGLSSGVQAISAGEFHTCAFTTSGTAKCWGHNESGQVGDGTTSGSPTPIDVLGLNSHVQAITAGGSHSCALTTSGGVECWGTTGAGQVGDGSTGDGNRLTPVDVVGLSSGVQLIDAGSNHTCVLTTSGVAKCWGANFVGQIGDGTLGNNRPTPVDVVWP